MISGPLSYRYPPDKNTIQWIAWSASLTLIRWTAIYQAPVVQRVDNAIHRINHYPVDNVVCFANTYPLDSHLSSARRAVARKKF